MNVGALITGKLQPPRLRPDHVHRRRLTDHLNASPVSLVVASAPAGSGKTTALVDWLADSDRPLAWYSLDHHDNDPVVFFTYLATALQPWVGSGRLSGLMTAPSDDSLDARLLTTALVDDLAGAPDHGVLVLEDLHVVSDRTIRAVLEDSVPHLNADFTLAIGTRSDPSLPLARMRAQGGLIELRSVDLAFRPDETRKLLDRITGVNLSGAAVDELTRRVEGWAVGLQLAGLLLTDRPDAEELINSFTGDARFVAEYLIDEVFERQTDDVQEFLLKTSVLERMSAGLCAAVTGNPAAGEILRDLYRRNVFITALDDGKQWFRYHHLFSDLLRGRLEQLDPGGGTEVMQTASQWCETEGVVDDALRYAVSSGDFSSAERLWEANAELLLPQGQIANLLAWLRLFPTSRIESNGELLLGRVWTNLFTLRADDALADLERAEAFDTSEFRFEIDGQLKIMRAMAFWEKGDPESSGRFAQDGLDQLPPGNRMLPSLGNLYLGRSELAQGQIEAALRHLTIATDLARDSGNYFAGISAFMALAAAYIQRGDLASGESHFRSALSLSEVASAGDRDFPASGAAHIGLGFIAFERYELEDAVAAFRRGLFDLKRTIYLDYTVLGFRRWSEAESMMGNHQEAEEILEEARTHLSQLGSGGRSLALSLADCEVLNLVRSGDVELARAKFSEIQPERVVHVGELAHGPFYRLATGIRLDIAQGQPEQIVAQARRLIEMAGTNVGLAVKALVISASASLAVDDQTTAMESLAEAVATARSGGWIRPFVEAGPGIAHLLADADLVEIAPKLVARVLELIPKRPVSGSIPQPLVDPLTQRELEVLDEIAAGRTNSEIGDRLFISVGTVKRHVANVFLKLGAGHRAEAVAKARSLGMFD